MFIRDAFCLFDVENFKCFTSLKFIDLAFANIVSIKRFPLSDKARNQCLPLRGLDFSELCEHKSNNRQDQPIMSFSHI